MCALDSELLETARGVCDPAYRRDIPTHVTTPAPPAATPRPQHPQLRRSGGRRHPTLRPALNLGPSPRPGREPTEGSPATPAGTRGRELKMEPPFTGASANGSITSRRPSRTAHVLLPAAPAQSPRSEPRR
eukprot:gene36439-18563_t